MKKIFKYLWQILLPAFLVIFIVFIWRSQNREGQKIIGVIPQYESTEFCRIREGLEKQAQESGYTLLVSVPSEMTVQAQRNAMADLISQGAACILIEAAAEGGFQEILDECSQKGVPVLAYNSRVNSSDIFAEVLPYPVESAADSLLAAMDGSVSESGQFGVLSTTSQDYLREARTRQMLNILETGAYPSLRFVGSGFVKEDSSLIAEKALHLSEKYPDLEYLLCYSTAEAAGMIDYINSNHASWKLICEASPEDLGDSFPAETVVLTYDYQKYGCFLMDLAVFAIGEQAVPQVGDVFRDSSGNSYIFAPKWGYDDMPSVAEYSTLSMQNVPDIVVCGRDD